MSAKRRLIEHQRCASFRKIPHFSWTLTTGKSCQSSPLSVCKRFPGKSNAFHLRITEINCPNFPFSQTNTITNTGTKNCPHTRFARIHFPVASQLFYYFEKYLSYIPLSPCQAIIFDFAIFQNLTFTLFFLPKCSSMETFSINPI